MSLIPATILASLLAVSPAAAGDHAAMEPTAAVLDTSAAVVHFETRDRWGYHPASGVVLTADGIIATVAHVIAEDTERASVTLADGSVHDAVRLLVADGRRDVALVKIPAHGLRHARLRDEPAPAGLPAFLPADGGPRPVVIEGEQPEEGFTTLRLSAPAAQRGTPVIDENGRVVGLATAGPTQAPLDDVIPASVVAGLLDEVGDLSVSAVAEQGRLLGRPEWTPVDPATAGRRDLVDDVDDVERALVTPFTSGNVTDSFGTSIFKEELRRRRGRIELIDPLTLASHAPAMARLDGRSAVRDLLAAGREVGADAVFVGGGLWHDFGFRAEVKLLSTDTGEVLWSRAASSGLTFGGPRSKRKAYGKIAASFPRGRR